MRDIKFRGYAVEELVCSQWITNGYGLTKIEYTDGTSSVHILTPYGDYNVVEESVGQYTGLKDVTGKEIFEGDIVQCNGNKEDLHEVKYGEFEVYNYDSDGAIDTVFGWHFQILENDKFSKVIPFCYPTPLNNHWIKKIDVKVVGNIYENKDLLECEANNER